MTRDILFPTALLVTLAALGGYVAALLALPMPWMLGALASSAALVGFLPDALPAGYRFPQWFRLPFIAVIGLTIGLQVTRDLLAQLPTLAISLIGITLFVPLAQFGNYWLFHRVGGFDRPTAFFAGSPGGLMESLLLGEANGAKVPQLTLQQFLRIIVVITLVPTAISIWVGEPVGSAAGLSNQMPASELPMLPTLAILAAVGVVGLLVGLRGHIPAGQLTGPLLAAALLNIAPLPHVAMPAWGLIVAQIVIGASLGARFHGLSRDMLMRGLGLSILSVGFMLALAGMLIAVIFWLAPLDFDALLISFAPGGVTEMGLIAITLHANPAVVALHHIYRIILTVLLMAGMARRMGITPPKAPSPPPSPSD